MPETRCLGLYPMHGLAPLRVPNRVGSGLDLDGLAVSTEPTRIPPFHSLANSVRLAGRQSVRQEEEWYSSEVNLSPVRPFLSAVRPFSLDRSSTENNQNCTMTATDLELESEAIQRITQPFPPGKAKGSPAFPRDCTRAVEAASQRNGRSTWCL